MYSTCVSNKTNSRVFVVTPYHDSPEVSIIAVIGARRQPLADGMVDDDVFRFALQQRCLRLASAHKTKGRASSTPLHCRCGCLMFSKSFRRGTTSASRTMSDLRGDEEDKARLLSVGECIPNTSGLIFSPRNVPY